MRVKVIAEVGINHSGDVPTAQRLIDVAASAGCDFVKFQKRTPELCVPDSQKNILRDTPWGRMTYLQYKTRIEFGKKEYDQIALHCYWRGIKWSASVWDVESLKFIMMYNPPWIKIPSACISDVDLMNAASASGVPLIVSTGMCDEDMVDYTVNEYGRDMTCLMHCVSTYPSKPEEQNLECISWMRRTYPEIPTGFSNHAPGLVYIAPAIALGASWIEFHVTLDRSAWGTDQSASIEPEGVFKAIKYIRAIELALGDGIKRIQDGELPIMQKLRRING
jgi:N-acetylneuraminate synthase